MAGRNPNYFVAYAPYLPLAEIGTVGSWHLIPQAQLEAEDDEVRQPVKFARNFAALFELPSGTRSPCGAFLHYRNTVFGSEPPSAEKALSDVFVALSLAVIDANPSVLDDEKDPNAGHRSMTSENARIVVAGISPEGYTTLTTGSRVPRVDIGIHVGDGSRPLKGQKIPAPADLRIPSLGRMPGFGYASAALEALEGNTDRARRIRRASLWLTLAWLNTEGFSDDLRIPALRAGFEVLLDREKSRDLARRLSSVLKDKTERVEREWKERNKPQTGNFSDIGWWFMRFSFLRNMLMHGTKPSAEDWTHAGVWHVGLGDAYLRWAIKATIAEGNPRLHREIETQRQVKQLQREKREGKFSP